MPPAEILAGIDFLLAGAAGGRLHPRSGCGRRHADLLPRPRRQPHRQPTSDRQPVLHGQAHLRLRPPHPRLPLGHQAPRAPRTAPLTPCRSRPTGWCFVDRNSPWVEYGFTDTVAKTGKVFLGSLLHWEACERLAQTYKFWEQHDDAHAWFERAHKAEARLFEFWDDGVGMYRSAQQDCRQTDVWASAYAAVMRVASQDPVRAHGPLVRAQLGQRRPQGLRPAPPPGRSTGSGRSWRVPQDTYQNGGYWAGTDRLGGPDRRPVSTRRRRWRLCETLVSIPLPRDGACEWISADHNSPPRLRRQRGPVCLEPVQGTQEVRSRAAVEGPSGGDPWSPSFAGAGWGLIRPRRPNGAPGLLALLLALTAAATAHAAPPRPERPPGHQAPLPHPRGRARVALHLGRRPGPHLHRPRSG